MALAHLGRGEDAQSVLAEAKTLHDQQREPAEFYTVNWHDWYMADIMLHEAESVLAAAEL